MNLLVFLLLTAPGAIAATIQVPRAAMNQDQLLELAAIQTLINTSKGYTTKIWVEEAKIATELGKPVHQRNQQVIASAESQIAQLRTAREKQVSSHEILLRTIKLYGLKPNQYSAPIKDGRYEGDNASWSPKYHEWAPNASRMDQKGVDNMLWYTDKYWGLTWINGEIWVTPDAMTRSPGYLAAVIFHETIHFEQFTDAIRAKAMTITTREYEAYTKTLNNKVAFGLTSNEVAEMNQIFSNAMNNLSRNPYANVPGLYGVAEPEPDKLQGEKGLLEGIENAKRATREIQETVKENIQRRERQAEEQERAEKKATEAAWKYLKTAVGYACSDPGGFQGRYEGGGVAPVAMDAPVLSGFVQRDLGSLNACERRLFQLILSSDKPVSAGRLAQEGQAYRNENPPLLSRIFKGLGDFLRDIDEYIRNNRPSREGREDGGGENHGGNGSFKEGPAYQQLKGIAR